jgi:hypothetical protein
LRLEARFKKALGLRDSFTENQKLILKALIKIRSKHAELALRDVYEKAPVRGYLFAECLRLNGEVYQSGTLIVLKKRGFWSFFG